MEKKCLYCGKLLKRKKIKNGERKDKLESPYGFKKRRFCGNGCVHKYLRITIGKSITNKCKNIDKKCLYCGDKLKRKRWKSGKMETSGKFNERNYCNKSCSSRYKSKQKGHFLQSDFNHTLMKFNQIEDQQKYIFSWMYKHHHSLLLRIRYYYSGKNSWNKFLLENYGYHSKGYLNKINLYRRSKNLMSYIMQKNGFGKKCQKGDEILLSYKDVGINTKSDYQEELNFDKANYVIERLLKLKALEKIAFKRDGNGDHATLYKILRTRI